MELGEDSDLEEIGVVCRGVVTKVTKIEQNLILEYAI